MHWGKINSPKQLNKGKSFSTNKLTIIHHQGNAKNTMSYHSAPTGTAKITKTKNSSCPFSPFPSPGLGNRGVILTPRPPPQHQPELPHLHRAEAVLQSGGRGRAPSVVTWVTIRTSVHHSYLTAPSGPVA